jgi:integrase
VPVRRHGSGWEVRIQHGGQRFSKTVATRSDAVYLEATLRKRLNDSRAGRTPAYSLEEALHRWLTHEGAALRSQETVANLGRSLYPFCRGRMLHEVVDVAAAVEADGRKVGNLPATINRKLGTLRRIAKLAYKRWGWLEHDLGSKIILLPGERKRTEYITLPQARRLIAAASGPMREMIRWALLTGLRRGELFALSPDCFRDGMILVHESKTGKPRAVPIPGELDPKRFPFGWNYNTMEEHWIRARRRARLPHIRFHDLRRTFGTWLLQGGAEIASIRDLLGHSTISMTSRYLGTNPADLKRAILTLPGLSRGRKAASHRGR